MPLPANLIKAELREIQLQDSRVIELSNRVSVQFNPDKLGLTFSNRLASNGENSGTAKQFVNRANTSLSVELWFDVTGPLAGGSIGIGEDSGDVRNLTRKVIYFFTPQEELGDVPPAVRFVWGTFLFDGVMTSMNESLEFFSEDGKPMRARVTFNILKEEISVPASMGGSAFGGAGGLGLGISGGIGISGGLGISAGVSAGISAGVSIGKTGTQPLVQARAGVSLQGMAAGSGQISNWKNIALANNIENPRRLEAGALVNVNISGKIKVE